jgi:hypothetical protein
MKTITQGDVVALAVDGVKIPPVGVVTELSDESVKLSLYRWSTYQFGYTEIQVRRRDIRATCWAQPFTPDALPEHINPNGEVIYDMDPLAEFQRGWTTTARSA